jgi:hypothetical protein
MKDDEVNIGQLSPCVRVFIELLLGTELPKSETGNAVCTEKSVAIKSWSSRPWNCRICSGARKRPYFTNVKGTGAIHYDVNANWAITTIWLT